MAVLGQDVGVKLIDALGLSSLDNITRIQMDFEVDKVPEITVTLLNIGTEEDLIKVFKNYKLIEKMIDE
jgi:flagellar biosynthesis GTPase FlhF